MNSVKFIERNRYANVSFAYILALITQLEILIFKTVGL